MTTEQDGVGRIDVPALFILKDFERAHEILNNFQVKHTVEVLQFIERCPESEIIRRGKSLGSIMYQLYEDY